MGTARTLTGSAGTALAQPMSTVTPISAPWSRDRLVALHNERSEQLELRGHLRQALEERTIALTINPEDRKGLRLVEPTSLLAAHPVDDPTSQTDLMVLRGGRKPPPE